jgi:hypothetical protein
MKKLFAILPLLLLCSCLSPQKTVPVQPPEPDINPYHALRLGAAPNLVITPQPKYCTNIAHLQWQAPAMQGVVSYRFYYGTNSQNYLAGIQLGSDTNYWLTNIDTIISTNPFVKTVTYPDGNVYTNTFHSYIAITAVYDPVVLQQVYPDVFTLDSTTVTNGLAESDYSGELVWPPLPPPPWSAVVISWDASRSVSLFLGSPITTPQTNWTPIPNPSGTNVVMLPLLQNGAYFRGVTTDLPPVQLKIIGGYINGTN